MALIREFMIIKSIILIWIWLISLAANSEIIKISCQDNFKFIEREIYKIVESNHLNRSDIKIICRKKSDNYLIIVKCINVIKCNKKEVIIDLNEASLIDSYPSTEVSNSYTTNYDNSYINILEKNLDPLFSNTGNKGPGLYPLKPSEK